MKKNKKKTDEIKSLLTDGIQLQICSECDGLNLNINMCEKTENKNIKDIIEIETGSVWQSKNLYIDMVINITENFEIIGFDPNIANIGEWVNGSIVNNEIVWEKNKENYKKTVSIGLWNSANGSIKNRNYDIIKKKLLKIENSDNGFENIMRSVDYDKILNINKEKNKYLKKSQTYHLTRRKRRNTK